MHVVKLYMKVLVIYLKLIITYHCMQFQLIVSDIFVVQAY